MQLKTWLKSKGLTPSAFATAAKLEMTTVHRAVHRKVMLPDGNLREHIPSSATMKAIMEATNGAVTPNDFFEDTQPARAVGIKAAS